MAVRRPPGWLALWLIPAAVGAAPGEPPAAVRVWASTRLELTSREVADEAGARWLEVDGRLSSDRGEPVGGAELRFERPGGAERCATDPTGRCQVRLRAPSGGTPWTARFDGGERLRPCSASVPTTTRAAGGAPWAVFLPLFVLGAGVLAALAVFVGRRLGPAWRRWRVAWRRRAAAARGVAPGGPLADPPVAVRRIRVLDALRYRPIAGARFVPEAPAGPALATTDTDGWAELPHRSDHLVAQAPGYVPEPVAAPPADGEPAERLALLRGRDALAILLEAPGGPEGRPAGTWPESILRLAGRVLPSADAQRVARLCYRRPGTLEPADRPVVEALVRRAVAAPAEAPVPYPALPELLDALSSEPPGGAGRAGSAPAAGPPGALQG